MNEKNYINLAIKECDNSYSPYSNFTVGALLITKSGKAYLGANIENQGIMSICAERVAFVKALSEGEREFSKIYVVGKNKEDKFFKETLPCGYCRQFMTEFCDKDFEIITYDGEVDQVKHYTLNDLLPHSFDRKNEL